MDFEEHPLTLKQRIAFAFICVCVVAVFIFCLQTAIMQSRESSIKAERQGKEAAMYSVPAEACPYENGSERTSWMRGYVDGVISQKKTAEAEQ